MEPTSSRLTQRFEMASSLYLRCLLLAVAIIAGFAAALTASVVHDIGTRTLALLSGYSIYLPLIALVGVVLLFLLVRYAEVAVALFLLAGLFKADERLVASPLDLTLVMAA